MQTLKNLVDILSAIIAQTPLMHLALYIAFINVVTFWMYRLDKQAAIDKSWRIPEATLHFAMFIGGTFGAIMAQRRFRHKTQKMKFQVMFKSLLLLQIILITALLFEEQIFVGM